MRNHHGRPAFTVIELLVALTMLGVAVAALVAALTGDRRMRDLAESQRFAADRMRERLESLAVLPCGSDVAGASASVWGSDRWNATAAGSAWRLTDSIALRRAVSPIVIEASVTCLE
jgi:prepilin-type N-terminal cleavage/methylation domain-containing protein